MIYVVRHGQTEWNARNRILGRTDIPLDETGIAQARQTAETVSGFCIARMLSSPLSRTLQTAAAISERIGVEIEIVPELIEMDFGIYEGRDRADAEYQRAKRELFSRYPGGESFLDVASRVFPLLQRIEQSGSDALLVTHNGICRMICAYYRDMPNEDFVAFAQGNCEIRAYGPRRFPLS